VKPLLELQKEEAIVLIWLNFPLDLELALQNLQLLAPLGRLVIFGNASAQPDLPLMPTDLLANNRAVLGYSFSGLTILAPQVIAATARQALALLANHQVRVNALHKLPLERAAEAHRLIETENTTGKLLLRVQP
jgi:NADPH2:quinone reductase